jgi:hypothetical protein
VGLVARELENAGFSTVCLSNIPDLTEAVGVPRLVGIEYPFGRTVGEPGDAKGQMGVVRSMVTALESMTTPGSVEHLPLVWPQSKEEARSRPPEPPPIAIYLQKHPWHARRLFSREIPR